MKKQHSIPIVYQSFLKKLEVNVSYENNVITPQQSYYTPNNTTIFDYEQIRELRKKYVKNSKTSQN